MSEYEYNSEKIVSTGEILTHIESWGVRIVDPYTTVKFEVESPGIYKVIVSEDGSWTVEKVMD